MRTVNGQPLQLAIEQSADSAMRNDGNISTDVMFRDVPHRLHDPGLRVKGGFPSTETCPGFGKKRVCCGLEKNGREKTGRTSIILAQPIIKADGQITWPRDNSGRFARLGFSAGPDMRDIGNPVRHCKTLGLLPTRPA